MSAPTPLWPCPHRCDRWARCVSIDLAKPMPNHHPRCEHFNASLIDVWSVRIPGEDSGLIVDSEQNAREIANEDPHAPLDVVPLKMHREVYENLPEFAGF